MFMLVAAGSHRQHALYIWDKATGSLVKMLTGQKGETLLDIVVSRNDRKSTALLHILPPLPPSPSSLPSLLLPPPSPPSLPSSLLLPLPPSPSSLPSLPSFLPPPSPSSPPPLHPPPVASSASSDPIHLDGSGQRVVSGSCGAVECLRPQLQRVG